MPIVLLVIGAIFLAAAIRGKQKELFDVMKDDFSGPNNFWFWGLALFIIGAVGYYKPLKPFSNAFMLLVVIVLFLKHGDPNSNGGFFDKFMQELRSGSGGSNAGASPSPVDFLTNSVNTILGK